MQQEVSPLPRLRTRKRISTQCLWLSPWLVWGAIREIYCIVIPSHMTPNEIRLIDLSAEESTAGVKPCAVVSNDSK